MKWKCDSQEQTCQELQPSHFWEAVISESFEAAVARTQYWTVNQACGEESSSSYSCWLLPAALLHVLWRAWVPFHLTYFLEWSLLNVSQLYKSFVTEGVSSFRNNDIPDAHWDNWGREVHCSPPKGMLATVEIAGNLSENCLSKYFF